MFTPRLFFYLLICCSSLCITLHASRYEDINHFMKESYAVESPPIKKKHNETSSLFASYVSALKNLFSPGLTARTLTKAECTRYSLQKIYELSQKRDPLAQTTVIDEEVWRTLDLFTNASNTGSKTVVSAINRTRTSAGEIMLTRMLLDPTTDIALLKKRQSFIATLLGDEQLFNTLTHTLTRIAQEEKKLLLLLDPHETFNQPEVIDAYKIVHKMHVPTAISAAVNFNFLLNSIDCLFAMFGTTLCASYFMLTAFKGISTNNKHWFKTKRVGFAIAGSLILTAFSFIKAGNFKQASFIPRYTLKMLSSLGIFLHEVHALKELFAESNLAELSVAINDYNNNGASQLEVLKNMLRTETFSTLPPTESVSFWSYVTTNKGTIANSLLATKKLLPQILNSFIMIGILDAYCSMATLMKERAHSAAPYCFAKFIENSLAPQIHAKKFHHPTHSLASSVTHSIAIGLPRSIVLTGINGREKLMLMKSLALCCIMAQTIGIAPAASFRFTPFARINTYLTIADDMSSETSLFKAELKRAQKLLTTVKNMTPQEFSFTIIDEICRGTEHTEGEALAYAIAKKLGEQPHTMTLIASHFPGLVELAVQEPTLYKNINVITKKDNDGSTTQHITPDILEKIGLPLIMTQKMRDVLKNPEYYQAPEE